MFQEEDKFICSYLSPDTNGVSDVVFTIRELSDAIVHSNTAFSRSKIFFCHFYPAQRAHSKALEKKPENIWTWIIVHNTVTAATQTQTHTEG